MPAVNAIYTTPQHPALTLNSDNTPASKFFKTLAVDNDEFVVQYYGQELIYDADFGDSGNDFTQLTNGTLEDDNTHTVQTKVLEYRTGVYNDK